ncbi:MAG: ABC transporter permease [Candidatus Hodarchaeales archaeon]|jgi:ABC-type transport system involved in multi-copper enzyme maturation permease subunit
MTMIQERTKYDYSPPLLSRGSILVQLFLNKYIYDRKTYILILISFLPLLAAGSYNRPGIDDFVDMIGPLSIVSFIIMPLISLILGVSAISDEKENKTISQLLTRPVKREEIVITKWITIMITGLVIITINSIILYLGFNILLPGSFNLFGELSVLVGTWFYLGLWYVVYATIFLFVGVFLDKNALGLGLAIAYFEAFFGQFIFGGFSGGSPFSVANHINYVASEYFLSDFLSYTVTNFDPFSSVLVCIGLVFGFLFLAAFTMRKKDFP